MMDDKSQIRLLKQGSENAFTYLYKQHWEQVYNFSRLYLNDRSTAEEVVQDVFVKLWESREFIHEDENFDGLLFIITRNLVFNRNRDEVNQDFYKMTILSAMEESSNSVEEEIEANDLRKYIDHLIEELPPKRREIFNLSRREHKSYKEIALMMNISEKTVENQISEALKFLKKNVFMLTIFLS
jgi:RNA polymerase sigma-70 factor, ECF subfamily